MRRRVALGVSLLTVVGCSAITSFDNFVGDGPDIPFDGGMPDTPAADTGADDATSGDDAADLDASSLDVQSAEDADAGTTADADASTNADADADPPCTLKTTGMLTGTQVSAVGSGGSTWNGLGNANELDGLVASVSLGLNASSIFLIVRGFGVTIPATAEVRGVQVHIVAKQDPPDGGARSLEVRLNPAGIGQSEDRATTAFLPPGFQLLTFGSPTDTWGLALTADMVKNAQFGAGISVRNTSPSLATAEVDNIQIEVHYCEK